MCSAIQFFMILPSPFDDNAPEAALEYIERVERRLYCYCCLWYIREAWGFFWVKVGNLDQPAWPQCFDPVSVSRPNFRCFDPALYGLSILIKTPSLVKIPNLHRFFLQAPLKLKQFFLQINLFSPNLWLKYKFFNNTINSLTTHIFQTYQRRFEETCP